MLRRILPLLLAGGVAACGADSSDNAGDNTPADGADTGNGGRGDATPVPEVEPEPEVPTYSGTCTTNDVATAFELGGIRDDAYYFYGSETPETPFMVWNVTAATDVEPGTYDLADQTPGSCDVCVYFIDGCDSSTQSCANRVDATEGYVILDEVGPGRLVGSLHNVQFGSAATALCADGFEFDVVIAPEEPATIGDEVMDFSLTNCGTGEPMSIHEIAGRTKALWFVGSAGWCSACRQFLPQVFELIGSADPTTLDLAVIVGENDSFEQPDVEFCRRYAARYGVAPDYFFIDHNGSFSFATLFAFMSPHAGPNGEFGLPWNAVIRGDQNFEYVYSDGTSGDLESTINGILAE